MARVLLVDDEASLLAVLASVVKVEKHEVTSAVNGAQAIKLLEEASFDLVITDIRMSEMSGLDLLRHINQHYPDLPVIVITAFSSIETAREAKALGAFDYVPKPFKLEQFLVTLRQALAYKEERDRTAAGGTDVEVNYYLDGVIAESDRGREVCDLIQKVAPVDTPVLITGPVGVGKNVLAKAAHNLGPRKECPFTTVTCAGVTEDVLEKDLFGISSENGYIRSSEGGTIYIRDVDLLPVATQARLLKAVRDKQARAVGSESEYPVNIRWIVGTVEDLEQLARQGKFRDDLRVVLSSVVVKVPPLETRREDIMPLVRHFMKRAKPNAASYPSIEPEAQQQLQSYGWPGNEDQLLGVVREIMEKVSGDTITKDDLPSDVASAYKVAVSSETPAVALQGEHLQSFIHDEERKVLKRIVEEAGGDKLKAARMLNISLAQLNRKLAEE
jgi:DNA-binding NtrC family response regulator